MHLNRVTRSACPLLHRMRLVWPGRAHCPLSRSRVLRPRLSSYQPLIASPLRWQAQATTERMQLLHPDLLAQWILRPYWRPTTAVQQHSTRPCHIQAILTPRGTDCLPSSAAMKRTGPSDTASTSCSQLKMISIAGYN